MDETIGVKGGKQDRRRMIKISQKKKKKLEEEKEDLKALEKKVKKNQIYTLVKALPIAIGGGFIKTIYDVTTGKNEIDKEDENSKWRIKEYDQDISAKTPLEEKLRQIRKHNIKIIVTPKGRHVVVHTNNKKDEYISDLIDEVNHEIKKDKKNHKKNENKEDKININEKLTTEKSINENRTVGISINENKKDDIKENNEQLLGKIKSRRIIEEYEKKLKEIRYEIRNAVFEYDAISEEKENIIESKDALKLIEELTILISKIEKIKEKMNIVNYELYDENYIYYLIEDYFEEFQNKREIKDIKESPLYILLSEKISELDSMKDKLKDELEDKKESLDEKEEKFQSIKEKYYSIENINKNLTKIQEEQEAYLKEIQRKIENATTIKEKIEYKFIGMNHQTNRMLRLMTIPMFLPGFLPAVGMAASTALHAAFLRNIMSPQFEEKKVKVIEVKDYTSDIKHEIGMIDDSINLLGKTSHQIDSIIDELKTKYSDYFGVVKECDEILNNLGRIKSNLKEKEFELEKIKQKQLKEIEKNEAKVLKRGSYYVN